MNSSVSIISSIIIFLFPYFGRLWLSRSTLSSVVLSLGMLGTFGGIFMGLLDFDANHIDAALPPLLEGLKTAFLTSIAGMCSSLLLRLCPIFYGIKGEKAEGNDESDIDPLLTALSNIEEKLQDANEKSNSHLETLNSSFLQFAQHTSDLNAKSITTALEKVMETWDSQMTGQVSTILSQINDSVKNLENIQTSHSEILKETCAEIKSSLEVLTETSQNIETFLEKTGASIGREEGYMVSQMNNLGNLLKNSENQIELKLSNIEEKFTKELSAMEQFSRTLITIVNKLAQDHDVISKRQKEDF